MKFKLIIIWCLLIVILYNPLTLTLYNNTIIMILTIIIETSLIFFSWKYFTLGFVFNSTFLLYLPYLLMSNYLNIDQASANSIIILIVYVFVITIINLFILASDIRDKKPLSNDLLKLKKMNTLNRSFLSFLIGVNKKQVVIKTAGIFILYVLLLYNLLFIFALLYASLGGIFNEGIDTFNNMLDAIYFSATTFFTIGFGDITPRDYSQLTKIIVIVQAILGHLITTVFWPVVIIFAFNKKSID